MIDKIVCAIMRWWTKRYCPFTWTNIFYRIDFCEVGARGLGSEPIDEQIAKQNRWRQLSERDKKIFRKDIDQLKRERRDYTRYITVCLA